MAFRSRNRTKETEPSVTELRAEKILDVDASMQGSLTFRDPVNLRINGKFEGALDTKGRLTIGEHAQVQANIIGENIAILGKVLGNVVASSSLSLGATAYLVGDVRTPRLGVAEGAILQGKCQMQLKETKISRSTMEQTFMTVEELARYLEVDSSSILDWARAGKVPAQREGNSWRFDRARVDAWIASEKIQKK